MTARALSTTKMNAVADSELVARSLTGREESFEELVRRYQRPLAAYVYRMVADYDAALDVTQEVFIKIYGSLAKYRSEFKFSNWIYKIAHNVAIDHLRRSSTREQSLTSESDGAPYDLPLKSSKPTPEQESERRERRTEIERVVSRLPHAYKDLILLRHSYDLSYDEIVNVTGLPIGTVKNRLFRAREILREHFLERGITGV